IAEAILFFLIIIFPYIIIGVNKTRQQPYSVPVLIAVSIPFDVAAAVIFAVRQKQKNLKKTICLGR
ncbi:hypothetical protein ABTG30_19090, partial [Acinetobacter baumannii]